MPFISENRLEEMLVKAVQSPDRAGDFYRLLLDSDLLVLGTAIGHEGAAKSFALEPGSQLKLVTGDRGGEKFLPVFSSLARMQDYVKEESKYLTLPGRALFELTRGAPVVLNPASEYGKELSPDEIAQLLDGAPSKPRHAIGETDPPPGFVEALTTVLEQRPDVSAAWMIQVTFADRDGVPHPLVGVELDGDMESLMGAIESAAAANLPGLVFDVQRIDRNRPSGMADALLQTPPFYERANAARILN